ncbi:hypothetical protein JNM87_02250 [Candidatus Saccharibacteria bacterium]|nr:hypothetical protein [Candidatus Saccharibacteria bacterium]
MINIGDRTNPAELLRLAMPYPATDVLLTPDFRLAVAAAGFQRIGIVATMISNGQLLMARHKQSPKLNGNVWGPLSETSQSQDTVYETATETLWRGMREELGMDPPSLTLATHMRRFMACEWNGENPRERSYAIVPIIHLPQETRQYMLDTFRPTPEIDAIGFWRPETIRSQAPQLRSGVLEWLSAVTESPLFKQPSPGVPFTVEPPRLPDSATDLYLV